MTTSITIVTADLTRQDTDAIVNAAHPSLLGGGGVDGAIHQAAGPQLLRACLALPEVAPGIRCPTGQARLTPGFELAARFVIHTVGPVWRGGGHDEARHLAECYRNTLLLALQHGLRSVAFPAISCGVYGFPPAHAAAVARRTLRQLDPRQLPRDLRLCCHEPAMTAVWRKVFSEA